MERDQGSREENLPDCPRPPEGALARAQNDLDAGKLDLARDRVTGFLYTLHRRGDYLEDAYELLGTIYFQMGELPKAGAAWLLTAKQGAEVDEALIAFNRRYGRENQNVLNVIKPRAPSDLYPEAVRGRLRLLNYRYAPYRPRSNPHVVTELSDVENTKSLRTADVGCLVMLSFIALMAFLVALRMLGVF